MAVADSSRQLFRPDPESQHQSVYRCNRALRVAGRQRHRRDAWANASLRPRPHRLPVNESAPSCSPVATGRSWSAPSQWWHTTSSSAFRRARHSVFMRRSWRSKRHSPIRSATTPCRNGCGRMSDPRRNIRAALKTCPRGRHVLSLPRVCTARCRRCESPEETLATTAPSKRNLL